MENHTLGVSIFNGVDATGSFQLSFYGIDDSQWHDVLFTWDGTTNANGAKLYIDDMVNPR